MVLTRFWHSNGTILLGFYTNIQKLVDLKGAAGAQTGRV